MVRMSASGLTCAAVMPYARSSCGVATYTVPYQFRPDAARCSEESVVSSWTMSPEPSEAAMTRASAAIAASLARVTWVGTARVPLRRKTLVPGVGRVPQRGRLRRERVP